MFIINLLFIFISKSMAQMDCAKLEFVGADKCEESLVTIDTSQCPGGSIKPIDLKIACEGFKAHGFLKFKKQKYKVELVGQQGMWGMEWKLLSPKLIQMKRTPASLETKSAIKPRVFKSKIHIYY